MRVYTKRREYIAVQLTADNVLELVNKTFNQLTSVNFNPPMLTIQTRGDGYKNVAAGWYLLFNMDGTVEAAKSENELKAEYVVDIEN